MVKNKWYWQKTPKTPTRCLTIYDEKFKQMERIIGKPAQQIILEKDAHIDCIGSYILRKDPAAEEWASNTYDRYKIRCYTLCSSPADIYKFLKAKLSAATFP